MTTPDAFGNATPMSSTITLRHAFAIDADTFWNKVFFDPEFNRRLYLDALEFPRFDPTPPTTEPDGSRTRRMAMEPKNEAPAIIQKLAGTLAYVEEGRWDVGDGVYRYTIVTSKLSDKVKMSGVVRAVPRGDREIERVVDVTCDVKIFGVGGVFESFIEKTNRETWEKSATFTRAFIAEKALSAG